MNIELFKDFAIKSAKSSGDILMSYFNSNHDIIIKILSEKGKKKREDLIKQVLDLALLSQGMLKGEDLTGFISRSVSLIK